MKTRRWILFLCCTLLGIFTSVIGTTHGQGKAGKKDTRIIDSVPAPNDEAIRKILDGPHWLNPSIIVYIKGYELILHDRPRNELRLKLDELETDLLRLPRDQWPLGKVVWVQETGISVSADDPQMVQNLTALRRMLKSHRVRVDLVPPA